MTFADPSHAHINFIVTEDAARVRGVNFNGSSRTVITYAIGNSTNAEG